MCFGQDLGREDFPQACANFIIKIRIVDVKRKFYSMDAGIFDKDVAFIQKETKVTMLGGIFSITAVTFYLLGTATLV